MHAAASSQCTNHTDNSATKRNSKARNASKQLMDLEDYVEEEKEEKNWKGIFLSILVIATVISFVIVSIIIVTPAVVVEKTGDKITIDEVMAGVFEPYSIKPIWSPDGTHFMYKTKNNELINFDCSENSSSIFLDNAPFREMNTDQFLISADKKLILFPYQSTKLYKHSRITRHKLYNMDTRLYRELIGPMGQDFQYVTWTNTGQGLVVIQQNNIYYKKLFSDTTMAFKQITFNGELETIYNGVPDWLYGEILNSDNAIWMSPTDRYMVYAEFNDTEVHEVSTVMYGDPTHKYTESKSQRYPKVGMTNPDIRLQLYNMWTNMTLSIEPPLSFVHRDYYLISVTWRTETSFAVTWLRRSQNVTIVNICYAATTYCYENLKEISDHGWVEYPKNLKFIPERNEYLAILPRTDGSNGIFNHIALIDSTVDIKRSNILGKKLFVTVGQLEVTDIVGYHDNNQTVLFLAIPSHDPKQRHLYSTSINKDNVDFRKWKCVTCDMDDGCLYVDVNFGKSAEYFVLGCLGPIVPYYSVYATPFELVMSIEDNKALRDTVSTKLLPVVDFEEIPTLLDDDHILSHVLLPPVLKKEEIIQFSLLVIANDYMDSQSVTYKFNIDWGYFMASFHSVIVARVDTRGSYGRGGAWSKALYNNMGILDVVDMITAVRFFKNLHYVNDNIAMVGQDYGGYLTTAVLSSDINDALKCGVAVSPITDFKYMDSYFSEKYHDNDMQSYDSMKLTRSVANLRHRDFLLLHGTSNGKYLFIHSKLCVSNHLYEAATFVKERVHFQHSAQYVKALVASNIYHHTKIFPDRGDLIDDEDIKEHVYTDIENFVLKCYGLPFRENMGVVVEVDEDDEE